MKREKLPRKTSIKIGLISGLFFAMSMLVLDYFNEVPFSILKLIINFFVFGLGMAIFFRYKYTKE